MRFDSLKVGITKLPLGRRKVQVRAEIGGVFEAEMGHVETAPSIAPLDRIG